MPDRDQRILDPIHGLIRFDSHSETDRLIWLLINEMPMQRLRRIKQLGFAEFVFPGATHSRFSHSIGVFHMARRLTEVVARKLGARFDAHRACAACVAALLHDMGHGPFSHAFEKSEEKRLGRKRKPHEDWTIDIIKNDEKISGMLEKKKILQDVIGMIAPKKTNDLYAAIVSSQFDADRLDYLRRDRYMSGIGSGAFDCDWLLDCLEIADDNSFYLNHKSAHNAEEYLLARYHLYLLVYTHKTTRAAEMMMAEILFAVADDPEKSGLMPDHPLRRYYQHGSIESYLALDDLTIWQALCEISAKAESEKLRLLSSSIRSRQFYKAFDAQQMAEQGGGGGGGGAARLQKFLALIRAQEDADHFLIDQAEITAYGIDAAGQDQIRIGAKNEAKPHDISDVSAIVKSIPAKKLCRIYASESKIKRAVALWKKTN